MSTNCTRCDGTGFINLHQVDEPTLKEFDRTRDVAVISMWVIKHRPTGCDVAVCDCCGDTESWYGEPGEHYNQEDPQGKDGPYAYNGGLCECH